MEEQLLHDPRTKQQIKDALYAHLYSPIQKQLKNCLDALIIKNTLLCGFTHKSFMYKSVLYNCDASPLPRKMNRLSMQLQPAMNDYLKELKELNEKELPFVVGFINQVLNSSNDLHDYLRLLPDSVHYPVEHLIHSCPCRTKKLADETISMLQEKNKVSIGLMKKRMVTNLLI